MNLKKIADGQTSEVFSLPDKKVVKLFHTGHTLNEVQREAKKCSLALKQGLPTPKVVEIVQVDNRQGIVFEECCGSTMLERMRYAESQEKCLLRSPKKANASMVTRGYIAKCRFKALTTFLDLCKFIAVKPLPH